MAGIADADKVNALASAAATDIRALIAAAAGSSGNVTRILYDGSWPARPDTNPFVEWVDPTGIAATPTAAIFGDTIIIGTTVQAPNVPKTAAGQAAAVSRTTGAIALKAGFPVGGPSGTDTRFLKRPVFAPDSFWTTPLPTVTPTDPDSAAIVTDLISTAIATGSGAAGQPHLAMSSTEYTPTVYVSNNSDPLVTFSWRDCMSLGSDYGLIANHLTNIRVPTDAVPSPGTDSEMTIYNRDTDEYTDTWGTRKLAGGAWSACWGGTIRNASTSDGRFAGRFGTMAVGFAFMCTVIRPDELISGNIEHVIGIAMPYAKPQTVLSWPASRGDGVNPLGKNVPAQGQRFRFPASLDLNSLNLSPLARSVAKAVQKYGMIVEDTAAAVHFRAINMNSLQSDPYPAFYRGRYSGPEFLGDPARGETAFPLELLELLPMNYGQP